MGVVIGVIIIFILICFMMSNAEQEKVQNNSIEVTETLEKRKFKTSKAIISRQTITKNEVRIDEQNKQIAICKILPYSQVTFFKFSDIIECEIIEDSNTIMKGGVGRAVVGGALAGGVGAIVGSTTRSSKSVVNSLQIRIVTSNVRNSLFNINLISQETNKEDLEYKNAMEFANNVYATITAIMNKNETSIKTQKNVKQNNDNFVEQLERLSKLKNDGMITDDEFNESKKQILLNNNTNKTEDDLVNHEKVDNADDIYNIEQLFNEVDLAKEPRSRCIS